MPPEPPALRMPCTEEVEMRCLTQAVAQEIIYLMTAPRSKQLRSKVGCEPYFSTSCGWVIVMSSCWAGDRPQSIVVILRVVRAKKDISNNCERRYKNSLSFESRVPRRMI